jgi:hypothetical protein
MAAQKTFAAAALALAAAGALCAEPVPWPVSSPATDPMPLPAGLPVSSPGVERPGPESLPVEPVLAQVEEAAARRVAGSISDEVSRVSRAGAAHWAPVIRAQYGIRDDGRTRRGQIRLAPLLEDDAGQSRAWAVVATWDLAQVIYARDEGQLALAHVHLARMRQQAADDAVRLFEERWRLRSALRFTPEGVSRPRVEMLIALLRTTALLDALTGGLYGTQLALAQEQVAALEPRLQPGSVAAPSAETPAAGRKQARRASGVLGSTLAPSSGGTASGEAATPPTPPVKPPAQPPALAEDEE